MDRRRSSLRLSLILPFVVLISVLTGVLGVLWYWTESMTVSGLSKQLMAQMTDRIAQAIGQDVRYSGAVLEAAFPEGLPEAADIGSDLSGLQKRLWTAASLRATVYSPVYYGNIAGQSIGLLRKDGNHAEIRLNTQPGQPRQRFSLDGITGTPTRIFSDTKVFDPRTRLWFKLASHADGPVWTPVYIDFDKHDLVMTLARRVLSKTGEFEGVVATDVFLHALQRFVDRLPLIRGGQIFILEPNGALIAASDTSNVRLDSNGGLERVYAGTSGDPMFEAVYAKLRPIFAQSGAPTGTALASDAHDGKIQIAYTHILDKGGLNWIAVVAIPEENMLAAVRRNVILVLALGMLALGLALAMGLYLFNGIAKDMRKLAHAVRQVGQGEINARIHVDRNDEIGELAHNFDHMRDSLFTDKLTGCANRDALQHILAMFMRKAEDGRSARPFALFFIDLNRFKPLNDRWGHENGDRALTEVTQRIKGELHKRSVLVRWGGDEFVAVLPDVDDDAKAVCERRRLESVLEPALTTLEDIPAGEEVFIGASIGYALYPRDGDDPQTLLRHADQEMYRRKNTVARS
ncbi:diguanylate cyclase domain-containing protein [Bordetella sp. FB-8]|uniref:sensor domain-containing diguanylate cyclase n=1 Tax=Bordetella sp. FB-8 TaxID=1159870 RepID=UPI0003AB1897|nr:diguanylate cyclase [Bordetella sp. FB-8]